MGSVPEATVNVDALVVGAGVAGIYSTYRLSRAGLNVECIDVAGDVGGTWYWNTYPGAMSDTETYLYRFSWDKEDLQSYPWSHHYVYQPEILKYLRHVTDKHDLRKHMRFNTEMQSASWDDGYWTVSCCGGLVFRARYLITCLGLLSTPNYPDIPGISDYEGELVHTAKWDQNVSVSGKTVGIIGNGSTGVQVMTAIAPEVKQLVSFQRHPQYSVPSGQGPIPSGYREKINENYDKIWEGVFSSHTGFGIPESTRKTMEATPEERREANEEACNFIRSKIDEIVKDPRKAEALKPWDLYARRPLCDSGYYQIFNRDNVDIVDLRQNSIEKIVPEGIQMADGAVHKLDVLVFATGFDAIEGNYLRTAIAGREGKLIKEHWQHGATAYGSVAVSGFPNMFLVAGPQGPFANFPPVIESEIEFITECIVHAHKNQIIMEATAAAEKKWSEFCDESVEGSLFKETSSWIFGANIKGRERRPKFYFGGLRRYREAMQIEVDTGFPSFAFQ